MLFRDQLIVGCLGTVLIVCFYAFCMEVKETFVSSWLSVEAIVQLNFVVIRTDGLLLVLPDQV